MPRDRNTDLQKQIDNQELSSHIQLQIEQESQNLFKNENRRRKAMSSGGRKIALLAVILLVLLAVSVFLVPYGVPTFEYWRHSVMTYFSQMFAMDMDARWRLACFVAIAMSGMAMTTAGAAYQGIFQNPMASPTMLGVQSGGTLGGLVFLLFIVDGSTLAFYTEHVSNTNGYYILVTTGNEYLEYFASLPQLQKFGLEIWQTVGCFFGVALIVGISMIAGHGKINTVALMLAGSVFSTVVAQLSSTARYVLLYNQPEGMSDGRYWLITQMSGNSVNVMDGNFMPVDQFLWFAIPAGVCLIVIFSQTGKLNVMMFGREEARAMGVPIQFYRIIFIIFCTLLVAVTFNLCGSINMIGFIIPHLARYMVGPDFKTLVPASALLGGITTLSIWDVASIFHATGDFSLYTGIVCSVMSLVFILLYRRQRHASWT